MTVEEEQNSFEDDEYNEDEEEAEEVIEDFNDEIKTESLSGEKTLPEGWIIKGKGSSASLRSPQGKYYRHKKTRI